MEAVAIVAPAGTNMSRFTSLLEAAPWRVEIRSENEAFLESGDRRAYFVRDDHLAEEYEETEIVRVLGLVPNPIFFALDFNDFSFGKQVLERIVDAPDLAVDTTHGTILRGSDFARRMREQPTWDWRRER
jgi:hypothetical protein